MESNCREVTSLQSAHKCTIFKRAIFALSLALPPMLAVGITVGYDDTPVAPIAYDDSAGAACTNQTISTISVSQNLSISRVSFGLVGTHTWRGELKAVSYTHLDVYKRQRYIPKVEIKASQICRRLATAAPKTTGKALKNLLSPILSQ